MTIMPHIEATGIRGPADWLATYLIGPRGVARWVSGSHPISLNTDRRGELEYRAARALALDREHARQTLQDIRTVGGHDPVSRYLSGAWAGAEARRLLASANVRVGDLEEAEALIESDASAEAAALRRKIAASRRGHDLPEGRDER